MLDIAIGQESPEDALRVLAGTRFFQGLDASVLLEIAATCRFKKLSKGIHLFRCGEYAYGFFIVASGTISLSVPVSGMDRVVGVFLPGNSIAEGTLSQHRRYSVDARAESDSLLLQIDRLQFLSLVTRRPELALRILDTVAGRSRMLIQKVADEGRGEAETKLIRWLKKDSEGLPGKPRNLPCVVRLPGTNTLLAAELGINPETLSRRLAALQERDVIRIRGRAIQLLDPGDPLFRDT